ncbi:MAG TPA: hypothetical protein VGC53_00230 [Vicinamibacteria bacterium]|jgi:hypothetical protein
MIDWLVSLTQRVDWDAWGTIATFVAVVVAFWAALLPGRGEERRRKAQAKSLRGRLSTALATMHPTFQVLSYDVLPPDFPKKVRDQKLSRERLPEVIEKVDRLAAESHILEPDEQNLLTSILANASLLAELYRTTDKVPRDTAAKVEDNILKLDALFEKHGYFH